MKTKLKILKGGSQKAAPAKKSGGIMHFLRKKFSIGTKKAKAVPGTDTASAPSEPKRGVTLNDPTKNSSVVDAPKFESIKSVNTGTDGGPKSTKNSASAPASAPSGAPKGTKNSAPAPTKSEKKTKSTKSSKKSVKASGSPSKKGAAATATAAAAATATAATAAAPVVPAVPTAPKAEITTTQPKTVKATESTKVVEAEAKKQKEVETAVKENKPLKKGGKGVKDPIGTANVGIGVASNIRFLAYISGAAKVLGSLF